MAQLDAYSRCCCVVVRRVMSADDEGAAPVGVTETTSDIVGYAHPNNPKLKFWDVPGVGTPRFPRDGYLEAIKVKCG